MFGKTSLSRFKILREKSLTYILKVCNYNQVKFKGCFITQNARTPQRRRCRCTTWAWRRHTTASGTALSWRRTSRCLTTLWTGRCCGRRWKAPPPPGAAVATPPGASAPPTCPSAASSVSEGVFRFLGRAYQQNPRYFDKTLRKIKFTSYEQHGHYSDVTVKKHPAEPSGRSTCRMHPLHVSFEDLNWQHWVIAPDGYDANFCAGNCNFPMHGDMNATNHAVVQNMITVRVFCEPFSLFLIF